MIEVAQIDDSAAIFAQIFRQKIGAAIDASLRIRNKTDACQK
jgi:hypothetical protein